jgi:hypothetical protein
MASGGDSTCFYPYYSVASNATAAPASPAPPPLEMKEKDKSEVGGHQEKQQDEEGYLRRASRASADLCRTAPVCASA